MPALFSSGQTLPSNESTLGANRRTVDPELLKAAALMVAPPYGTALALQVDPRRLRAIMEKGEAVYRSAAGENVQIESAQLIQVAAVLGYGPARRLIVRDYARSRVIRMTSPEPNTVRFALDAFTGAVQASGEVEQGFVALATYFVARRELGAFAVHIVETIRDDSRLQVDRRLGPLFASLAQIEGACVAIARIVSAVRTPTAAECSSELQKRVRARVRAAGPVGREDDSRRYALWRMQMLDNISDPEQLGSAKPVVRVLPGFYSPPVSNKSPLESNSDP